MISEKKEGTIRVMLDLTPGGVKNVMVFSETPEDREQALALLQRCLPQLELLESELQRRPETEGVAS